MNQYCAFLRGVNVNGRKLKMAEVCQVFQENHLEKVHSVLATGNILFQSKENKAKLKTDLEAALAQAFQVEITLFIKEMDEVKAIVENNPFQPSNDLHCYIFICESGFEKILMEKYQSISPVDLEDGQIRGGYFYWQVPKGMTLDAGFSKILGSKKFKERFTSRNLKTMERILSKM